MTDPRLQAVAATLSDVFGSTLSPSSILSTLSTSSAAASFLDDPHTVLLCASTSPSSPLLSLSNTATPTPPTTSSSTPLKPPDEETKEQLPTSPSPSTCSVHLLKRSRAPLPPPPLTPHVLLLTTFDHPLYSLYLTMHEVYSPKLAHHSASIPLAVQQHFIALETQLHRALLQGEGDGAGGAHAVGKGKKGGGGGEGDEGVVGSVDDEVVYWEAGGSPSASTFLPHLSTLRAHVASLSSSPLSSILPLLEDVIDALNDLWLADDGDVDAAYPQPRMERLLEMVEGVVGRRVREELTAKGWGVGEREAGATWVEVREWLTTGLSVCDGWLSMRTDLTRQSDWRPRWRSPPPTTAQGGQEGGEVYQLKERIATLIDARALYEELVSLLPSSQSPSRSTVFAPFSGVSVFHPSPLTAPLFAAALAGFHASLAGLEAASTAVLRSRLVSLSSQPLLLLNECRLYPTLLSRPSIITALEPERRLTLQKMTEMVDDCKADFDAVKASPSPPTTTDSSGGGGGGGRGGARELSPFLQRLGWAHQLRAKLHAVALIVTRVFPGKETERFSLQTRGLGEKIGAFAKQAVVQWTSTILASLADPSSPLQLSTSGAALMELDLRHGGELVVHYSPQLVALLRDCRLLSELGYRVDSSIERVVRVADKYYRYGLKLRQIANFYNSMGEQILPSQLGLLVLEAQAFEAVVKEGSVKGKGWNWDRPDECDRYIERLEGAAEELMKRNRRVRGSHFALVGWMQELLGLEAGLWKRRERLMELVNRMRALFVKEEKAHTAQAMQQWRLHWDHQLYKAMATHYRALLYSFTEQSIDIPVELCLTRRRLTFRPPLEEVRSSYYRSMKKLLDLPKSFTGFADTPQSSSLYASIPERNAEGLSWIFAECERMMAGLEEVMEEYRGWAVLGLVDVEEQIEQRLRVVGDWELNFKALKVRRKDVERVPDVVRVGCFSLSLLSLKATLDDVMHRFSDALLLSLRQSTQSSQQAVDEYLKHSMQRLAQLPSSMADMEEAKRSHDDITAAKPAMQQLVQEMQDKDALLRAMTSTVSVDLTAIRARWDDFLTHSDAYSDYLTDQKDKLKDDVQRQCSEQGVKVDAFISRWTALKPSTDVEGELTAALAESMVKDIDGWKEEWTAMKAQIEQLNSHCQTFSLPLPTFAQAAAIDAEIASYSESWSFFTSYRRDLEVMGSEQWVAFRVRLSAFDDLTNSWAKRLKQRGVRDKIFDYLQRKLKSNRELFPILRKVTGELYEKEHWRVLFGYLGLPSSTSPASLTFQQLLDKGAALIERNKDIGALTARAQGEVTIREAVEELKVWGEEARFSLLDYDASVVIIRDWKELFTTLSEKQALVSSLHESPYYALFEDTARQIEGKLTMLDVLLHTLNTIQRKWVYLHPIFSKGALPNEQARFKRIDADFRQIMVEVKQSSLIMSLTTIPHLTSTVQQMNEQMDRCQRALNEYLEEKRSSFPRFYFIGDDDLLEILGQSAKPTVIQSHVKKLFAGCHEVEFDAEGRAIVAVLSAEKERVPLRQLVRVTEDVEGWLNALTASMEGTLQQLLVECCSKGSQLDLYPSQVLCLAEMIHFTERVEAALRSSTPDAVAASLQSLLSSYQLQLREYTSFDTHDSHLLELKLKSLIFDLIHNLDVLRQLLEAKACSVDHWMWSKQLRFYLDAKGLARVRMVGAEFAYTYEYQGNYEKLVHTPLSDKCYLVLTQGMHLGYGGCPFGPAGTGKTESVKALAAAMGRICLVFNCDEGIDFQSMGRIFTGLVKSGAWGCFDEFNRLKEDQLSAVSQQIQVIQAALKQRQPTCTLLNQTIHVNPNAAIFVTMNPASKEYGGRSKLPHNLKQLFRDVAMAAPDISLIAEVILLAAGFTHAGALGRKIVETFDLSRQLLSPQRHYDWGLRALKTILRHADELVHVEKRTQGVLVLTLEQETTIVIGALRINTLSKLTFADSVRFNALLSDVFPGVRVQEIDYAKLTAAVHAALDELKLERVDKQVNKIVQLFEAAHQRMGVVLVGPSGCGKSTMLQVLEVAMGRMGQRVVRHVMNPKAMERQKLLGWMDYDTREFRDGTLIAASRAVMREALDVQSWVVCDGDIDPEWIESLNSVLDDNHLLTMPNGERIKFAHNVNFIFESHDLQYASPATVSRMGMIFLSEEDVDVRSLTTAWVKRQKPDVQARLAGWLDELFYQALTWTLDCGGEVVKRTKVGLVQTALSHLRAVECKAEFAIGLIRGMGSNLELGKRQELAKQIFAWSGERPADVRLPLDSHYDRGVGSIVGYQPVEGKRPMGDDEETATALSFRSPPLILTQDVQRHSHLIEPWLRDLDPFILAGPEGCGKTLLLEHLFRSIAGCSVVSINCSAETCAAHVIQKLNDSCQCLSTPKGRVFRPKEGERLILFLKDINLPRPDRYDTIQLIAFLQQLITYRGFYDDGLEWVGIERVQVVATMNPVTAVGRSTLSTRFTATVHVAYMTYPDHEALVYIYSALLSRVVQHVPKLLDESGRDTVAVRKLTATMVDVYEKVRAKLSVDDHRHYLFCPRDLTQWTFGLLRYDLHREPLLTVVAHEARRLFGDRLVDSAGSRAFESILQTALRQQWKFEAKEERGEEGGAGTDAVYFTSMAALSEAAPAGSGGGVEAAGSKELGPPLERMKASDFREIVVEGLRSYERDVKALHMLLFPEVLDHLAFEDRVLSRPGGSLLLIGDSGVGRRSSLTLLCHMQRVQLHTPQVSAKYDLKAFRAELKELMRRAGVEGAQVVLYLEDYQLVLDAMLEDVNSLLSAGEISGLYAANEMDALLSPLKDDYVSSATQHGCKSLYDYFVQRVRGNLHIVLSMDPQHPLFHRRCESNPALYARMSIQWMGTWTDAGLAAVSAMRLTHLLHSTTGDGQPIEQQRLVDSLLYIHSTCRAKPAVSGVTPLKFVAFLDAYVKLFDSEQRRLLKEKSHLTAGLAKLTEAAAAVDVLSKDAGKKAQLVSTKQTEADAALDAITSRMAQASERKVEVEQLQTTLSAEEAKLNVEKATIAQQLKEVEPILQEAKQAVGGIKKDNLNEIRAFRMPPQPITHVLGGVLGLLKQEDTSWASMKKFLASPSVKEEIMNFDAGKIERGTREKVKRIIEASQGSFDAATITRVNVAAAPLAKWVLAVVRYSEVFDEVKPLQDRLDAANAKLDSARERLAQCKDDLRTVDADVKKLKTTFGKVTGEAETLKVALEKTNATLQAAQSLLSKLSGEQQRWDATVHTLSTQLHHLTHHAMLAAAFITYLGGCDEDVRADMMATWTARITPTPDVGGEQANPTPAPFDFMSFMATESTFLTWKAEGLSSDALSMQNGLVIQHSQQTPFILDPNAVAITWLARHLQATGVSVEQVQQHDPKLVHTLELAVRFGKTLLINEVDGAVLPLLYPLLRKDLVRQGPRSVVQIGEKAVDYNDSFKLFLITRNPHADLTPAHLALVNSINFTVTRSGLEGQLLGLTLAHEKPELETKKSALLASEDQLKLKLAALEAGLLQALASSQGNVLENRALLESLNQTKEQSVEVMQSLAVSKEIAVDLDRQREVYRPIAAAGSRLFFLLAQLTQVNTMYDFALPTFTQLFNTNLREVREEGGGGGGGGAGDGAMIARMVERLKLSVFGYVTRSLFKADRLMFALHLLHCLYPQHYAEREWEFFIDALVVDTTKDAAADAATTTTTAPVPPVPSHFPSTSASTYQAFALSFPHLLRALRLSDESAWAKFARSPRPEADFPPPPAGQPALTPFQRLLVIKTLRPDRLQSAMTTYACESLGISSMAPPPFSLPSLCKEVDHAQPILFICEGGADPTSDLEDFAHKTLGVQGEGGGGGRLVQMAMGSGQTEEALEALKRAAKEGHFLLLKNVHLCCAWCVVMEKTLKQLQADGLHPTFRLFLTTEPHPSFPPILLQASCKLSYEAPPGIKQNLLRTYSSWDATFIAQGGSGRAQLLFILAWFHAVVQERRTYIPQGWTKAYEFSAADLRSAADIIDELCRKAPGGGGGEGAAVPWTTIWGLLKFAIYGGRIDVVHDERVLLTYLRKFFHKDILSTQGKDAGRKLTAGLTLPTSTTHGEYVALIQRLPDVDTPNLFSLPDNIDAALQQNQSTAVVAALRKLQVTGGSLGRFDRQTWKAALGPLCAMWDKLTGTGAGGGGGGGGMTARGEKKPPAVGLLTRPPRLRKGEEAYTPLESFVVNENAKVHDLLLVMHGTLSGLSAVLQGHGLLTDDLFSEGQSLMLGCVPWWKWCRTWVGPDDPAVFVREVVGRKQALLGWLAKADKGQLLEQPLSLADLFTPKVFLNALRQQTARESGHPIDELRLVASFRSHLLPTQCVRVSVVGLMLQGCGFAGEVLSPLVVESPSLLQLPECWFGYIGKGEAEPYGEGQNALALPLYFSPSREQLVCEVKVPCKGQLDRWILTGAALFITQIK